MQIQKTLKDARGFVFKWIYMLIHVNICEYVCAIIENSVTLAKMK